MLLGEERGDQILPRVQVVHDQQQLAEARLAEVVGEQLDVAAGQLGVARLLQRRRAANQGPELRRERLQRLRRRQRTADQAARAVRRAPCGSPARRATCSDQADHRPPPAATRTAKSTSRGTISGSAPGENHCCSRPPNPAVSALPALRRSRPASAGSRRGRRGRRSRSSSSGNSEDARRQPGARQPPRAGPPPADRTGAPRRLSRCPRLPTAAAPPSTAANSALTAPMPRPATRSILHAGFVERAQHAGVVGAGRARAREDERRPQTRRIEAVRTVGRNHGWRRAPTPRREWWSSLTSSNWRLPAGVVTVTSSPSSLFSMRAADRRGGGNQSVLDVGILGHDQLIDGDRRPSHP